MCVFVCRAIHLMEFVCVTDPTLTKLRYVGARPHNLLGPIRADFLMRVARSFEDLGAASSVRNEGAPNCEPHLARPRRDDVQVVIQLSEQSAFVIVASALLTETDALCSFREIANVCFGSRADVSTLIAAVWRTRPHFLKPCRLLRCGERYGQGGRYGFGRKGIGGNNIELEEQRQHWTDRDRTHKHRASDRPAARLQSTISQRLVRWPGDRGGYRKNPPSPRSFDQIKAQVATAAHASPIIDQHLSTIDELLAVRLTVLDSFAAVLIGRQHVWNAGGLEPGSPFNPTVREAQQALHTDASRLAGAVQEYIDELRPLREQHQAYWPAQLNLEHIQAYLDDGQKALDVYADQFVAHNQPLPPQSSIELLILAQRMEKGVEMIETERQNLAVTIVARNALKNSGLT